MSDFIIHAYYAILFCLVFAIGSFVWDFDHLLKCNSKALFDTAMNPSKGYKELADLNQAGCRGFTHSLWFGIGFLALFLGYMLHMYMDYFHN